MLAFMPRSVPPLDSHCSHPVVESRRPLALLPSTPMSYNPPSLTAALPPSPSAAKRPKLSLNTSSISPIFGKSATSLRLETLSATSPTARNTFQNRYDGASTPTPISSPQKPILTPIATNLDDGKTEPTSPSQISLPDSEDDTTDSSRSRTTSVTSISTVDSSPPEAPYKLPFNANSILSNGPLPRSKSRILSFSQSRPMFPAPKKVVFRAPLTEEVRNTKYTLRHSDIDPSSPSILTLEPVVSKDDDIRDTTSEASSTETVIKSPTGVKRDSEDAEDETDIQAATPLAGRAKRHRWVWTLPPVQSATLDTSSLPDGPLEAASH